MEEITSRWHYVGLSLSLSFLGTYLVYVIARAVVPKIEHHFRRTNDDKVVEMLRREGIRKRRTKL